MCWIMIQIVQRMLVVVPYHKGRQIRQDMYVLIAQQLPGPTPSSEVLKKTMRLKAADARRDCC